MFRDDRRRVLVLNHFAAPRGQAGGTRHVELFSRLHDWEFLVVASDLNPQTGQRFTGEPGLAVVPVSAYSANGASRILNWVTYSWRALFLGLRQRNLSAVYGSSPHLFAALTGLIIARTRRIPFVLEVRDLWPQVLVDMGQLTTRSRVYKALRALEAFLYSRSDAIVVMAHGSGLAIRKMGVESNKIHYIPNGADISDFKPSLPKEVLRQRYGFTRLTAIYAGAHGPANGLDLLMDAADRAADLGVDIVLVGGGILKSQLMDEARERSLRNVRFLDAVSKDEIPDLLAAADIGLHVLADVDLFRAAVSPNKVFDYMAAGLPIVTNSPGVVSDLVHEAQCGVTVEPGALAQAFKKLVEESDPNELVRMGVNGKVWIDRNQSRTAMADRLGRLLDELDF